MEITATPRMSASDPTAEPPLWLDPPELEVLLAGEELDEVLEVPPEKQLGVLDESRKQVSPVGQQ